MSLSWWSVPVHNLCHADTYCYTLHPGTIQGSIIFHSSKFGKYFERFQENGICSLYFFLTKIIICISSQWSPCHINLNPGFLFDSFSLRLSRIYESVLIWPMMWRWKFLTFLINLAFILWKTSQLFNQDQVSCDNSSDTELDLGMTNPWQPCVNTGFYHNSLFNS